MEQESFLKPKKTTIRKRTSEPKKEKPKVEKKKAVKRTSDGNDAGTRNRKKASTTKEKGFNDEPAIFGEKVGITAGELRRNLKKTTECKKLKSKPILDEWYRVKLDEFTPDELGKHKLNLSVRGSQVNYVTGELPDPTLCYRIKNDYFCVPKWYGIKMFGTDFEDRQRHGSTILTNAFDWSGPEMEEATRGQVSALSAIIKELQSPYGGALLAMAPGEGKTIVGLKAAATLGKTTLVIVHKNFLLNQWKERIQTCLPNAKIGFVYGDTEDVDGKDIVICMVQSIVREGKYADGFFDRFGFVIIDEAHHFSANKWSKSLTIAGSRHILALTGTPYKKDGSDVILNLFIGPVTFQRKKTYTAKVTVKVVEPKYPPPKDKVNRQGKLHYAFMLNDLASVIERNQRIVKEIMDLIPSGRQMLVLTDRREHITVLREMMIERDANESSIGIIIGGMKEADQQKAMTKNIIFSTYPMCSEALDIPTLSIVVLATPKPDVRQSVARIMRSKSAAISPLIVDILDKRSMWIRFWYTRHRFYKAEGYDIQFEAESSTGKEEIVDDDIDMDMDEVSVDKKAKREVDGSVSYKFQCPF